MCGRMCARSVLTVVPPPHPPARMDPRCQGGSPVRVAVLKTGTALAASRSGRDVLAQGLDGDSAAGSAADSGATTPTSADGGFSLPRLPGFGTGGVRGSVAPSRRAVGRGGGGTSGVDTGGGGGPDAGAGTASGATAPPSQAGSHAPSAADDDGSGLTLEEQWAQWAQWQAAGGYSGDGGVVDPSANTALATHTSGEQWQELWDYGARCGGGEGQLVDGCVGGWLGGWVGGWVGGCAPRGAQPPRAVCCVSGTAASRGLHV
jgi:hypothetical protein